MTTKSEEVYRLFWAVYESVKEKDEWRSSVYLSPEEFKLVEGMFDSSLNELISKAVQLLEIRKAKD